MPIVAPSILSADFGQLADEVRAVTDAGADWIHVDVMDGHFVPPITIGPLVVEAIRRATHLPLDVHLMIEGPERHVADFVRAGADWLTVHVEAGTDVAAVLAAIRTAGARSGLALNPPTPRRRSGRDAAMPRGDSARRRRRLRRRSRRAAPRTTRRAAPDHGGVPPAR